MLVKFSGHAKRRAKLYKIPGSIVNNILSDLDLSDGEYEFIRDMSGFKYPIKIVGCVLSGKEALKKQIKSSPKQEKLF